MSNEAKEYHRLPGRGRGLLGYHTLWLGRDHLLSIHSTGYTEDYKRFYYGDIQAMLTRKTARGKVWNVALGAAAAGFALLAMRTDGALLASLGMVSLSALLLLLVNFLRGPTCVCHLYTAVQRERLPSLNRLQTARKAIVRLRPLIERAQGSLRADARWGGEAEWSRTRAATARRRRANQSVRHEHGGFHEVLYYLLLFDGLLTSLDLFYNDVRVTLLGILIAMAVGTFMVIALVRQHGSDMTGPARGLTWGVLGYLCFSFFTGYVLMIVVAMNHPQVLNSQWEMIEKISALSPLDSPWLTGCYLLNILCSFGIGALGLVALKRLRARQDTAPPPVANEAS